MASYSPLLTGFLFTVYDSSLTFFLFLLSRYPRLLAVAHAIFSASFLPLPKSRSDFAICFTIRSTLAPSSMASSVESNQSLRFFLDLAFSAFLAAFSPAVKPCFVPFAALDGALPPIIAAPAASAPCHFLASLVASLSCLPRLFFSLAFGLSSPSSSVSYSLPYLPVCFLPLISAILVASSNKAIICLMSKFIVVDSTISFFVIFAKPKI